MVRSPHMTVGKHRPMRLWLKGRVSSGPTTDCSSGRGRSTERFSQEGLLAGCDIHPQLLRPFSCQRPMNCFVVAVAVIPQQRKGV